MHEVSHSRCRLVQPGELVCAMTAGLALPIVHPPARWRACTAECSTFHNELPRCWKTRCWRPRSQQPTSLGTSKLSCKTRYWRTRPRKPTLLHQRQATAGASRPEKVRDDSGQATERRVASRRAGLQTCDTRHYLGGCYCGISTP